MKSKIFVTAVLAFFLAGCTTRAEVEAAQAAAAAVAAKNEGLVRENEAFKKDVRERQAIADATTVCAKEARSADYRHVNACKTVPLALAVNLGFMEFRAKMVESCRNSCRETTLALASERKLQAQAVKKSEAEKIAKAEKKAGEKKGKQKKKSSATKNG